MSAMPRWATERTDRATFGPKVLEVAAALGYRPMPHQELILNVALEHDGAGRLAYRDVVVSLPRQASKTTTAWWVLLWRMLASPCRAAFGAQSRNEAAEKLFLDVYPMLQRSRLSSSFTVTRQTGRESLRTVDGSSTCKVISSDESAGHGSTLSMALLDEAWAIDSAGEAALRPAMSTKRNGQLWVCSTAGTPRSSYWRAKVESGREAVERGDTSGMAYFEWSAPPGADLHDPEVLAGFHPAVGHSVDVETLLADIKLTEPAEARRAFGNNWSDEDDSSGWGWIERETWAATAW